jgi:hypothetical protein
MDRTEEAVRFPARVVVGGGGGGRDGEEAAIFTVQGEAESGRTSPCEAGERTRQLGARATTLQPPPRTEIFLLPPRLLGSARWFGWARCRLATLDRQFGFHSGPRLGDVALFFFKIALKHFF